MISFGGVVWCFSLLSFFSVPFFFFLMMVVKGCFVWTSPSSSCLSPSSFTMHDRDTYLMIFPV